MHSSPHVESESAEREGRAVAMKAPCIECEHLRSKIVHLEQHPQRRPVMVHSGMWTDPFHDPCKRCLKRDEIRYADRSMLTEHRGIDVESTAEIEIPCEVCVERSQLVFYAIGINTELVTQADATVATELVSSDNRGTMTATVELQSIGSLTEPAEWGDSAESQTSAQVFLDAGALRFNSTQTDRIVGLSVGVNTPPVPPEKRKKEPSTPPSPVPKSHAECQTLQLEPIREDRSTRTEEIGVGHKAIATENPQFAHSGTDPLADSNVQLIDGSMVTDAVEIREVPDVKHVSTETQPLAQKSQFVTTDQVACAQRGTDMGIKHRDVECAAAIFLSATTVSRFVETEKLHLVNRGSSDDRVDSRSLCESCVAQMKKSVAECGCQVEESWKALTDVAVETDLLQTQPQQEADDDEFYLVVGSQQELDAVTKPPKQYQEAAVDCNIDELFESLHLCSNCKRPVSSAEAANVQQELWSPLNSPLTPNAGSFDVDTNSLELGDDEELVDDLEGSKASWSSRRVDFTKPRGTRATELSRAAATKKLLTTDTEDQQQKPSFQRGTYMSRSCRVESRKGDPLAYITEKRSAAAATPASAKSSDSASAVVSSKPATGLRRKVEITKRRLPQLPAGAAIKRQPTARPGKRPPATETVEPRSAGEEEEANDTVGPLPSEVQQWQQQVEVNGAAYDNPAMEDTERPPPRNDGRLVGDLDEQRYQIIMTSFAVFLLSFKLAIASDLESSFQGSLFPLSISTSR